MVADGLDKGGRDNAGLEAAGRVAIPCKSVVELAGADKGCKASRSALAILERGGFDLNDHFFGDGELPI